MAYRSTGVNTLKNWQIPTYEWGIEIQVEFLAVTVFVLIVLELVKLIWFKLVSFIWLLFNY